MQHNIQVAAPQQPSSQMAIPPRVANEDNIIASPNSVHGIGAPLEQLQGHIPTTQLQNTQKRKRTTEVNAQSGPGHGRMSPYPIRRRKAKILSAQITRSQSVDLYGLQKTEDAIITELMQMLQLGVWEPTLTFRNALTSSVPMKDKRDADGNHIKLKARFVAHGNRQKRAWLAEPDISSPTADMGTVNLFIAIATYYRMDVVTVDVVGAYLNAYLDERDRVYVRLDARVSELLVRISPDYAEYVQADGTIVVRLLKALYGLLQSGKRWHDYLIEVLEGFGFDKSRYDPCLFMLYGEDGTLLAILVLFVDDMILGSLDGDCTSKLLDYLRQHVYDITVKIGQEHAFLGVKYNFYTSPEYDFPYCEQRMDGYIREIIDDMGKYGELVGTAKTPATEDLTNDPWLSEGCELLIPEMKEFFHSMVAKMLFASQRVRFDILFPVQVLTRRVSEPTTVDLSHLYRIGKYLKDHPDLTITIRPRSMLMSAYVDAGHQGHYDGRDQVGAITFLGVLRLRSDPSVPRL